MSFVSRLQVDSLEIGTLVNAGVVVKVLAGTRAPFSGPVGTGNWATGTNYIVGNSVIFQGDSYVCILNHTASSGNSPLAANQSYDSSGTGVQWAQVDGAPGDIWILGGSQGAIYQKIGNNWSQVNFSFANSFTVTPSQTNATGFTLSAASFKSMTMDYFISTPTGAFERGNITLVNDGTNAIMTQDGIVSINGPLGVDFDAAVSGTNLNFLYTSDSQVNRTVFYFLKR